MIGQLIADLVACIPAGVTGPQAAVACAVMVCTTAIGCTVFDRVTRP